MEGGVKTGGLVWFWLFCLLIMCRARRPGCPLLYKFLLCGGRTQFAPTGAPFFVGANCVRPCCTLLYNVLGVSHNMRTVVGDDGNRPVAPRADCERARAANDRPYKGHGHGTPRGASPTAYRINTLRMVPHSCRARRPGCADTQNEQHALHWLPSHCRGGRLPPLQQCYAL